MQIDYQDTSTVIDRRVGRFSRKGELYRKWSEFAHARLVITDRLHGMIFAAITGTACIALDNRSGKVSGSYEFIKDLDYIRFLASPDGIEQLIMEMYES
jgi:pyruvyl transferase EpsI